MPVPVPVPVPGDYLLASRASIETTRTMSSRAGSMSSGETELRRSEDGEDCIGLGRRATSHAIEALLVGQAYRGPQRAAKSA